MEHVTKKYRQMVIRDFLLQGDFASNLTILDSADVVVRNVSHNFLWFTSYAVFIVEVFLIHLLLLHSVAFVNFKIFDLT